MDITYPRAIPGILQQNLRPSSYSYLDHLKVQGSSDLNIPLFSLCYILANLLGDRSRQNVAFMPAMTTLITLSLVNSAEAGVAGNLLFNGKFLSTALNVFSFASSVSGWSPLNWLVPKKRINRILEDASNRATVTLNHLNEIITVALEKVEGLEHKFMADFGEKGQLLIETAGDEIRMSSENIMKGAQATLNVAGYEARATIQAAGREARVNIDYVTEKVNLTLKEGHKADRYPQV